MMIEKKMHLGDLYSCYGPLLTDKQIAILDLYVNEDYSLGEIAELLSISRQAVNDTLKKAEKTMAAYEDKLGYLEKQSQLQALLEQTVAVVEREISPSQSAHQDLIRLLAELQDL